MYVGLLIPLYTLQGLGLRAMAKSREQVQQLGFWDTEVSETPHDKIQIWAYENADYIFREVCPDLFEGGWRTGDPLRGYSGISQRVREAAKVFAVQNPRPLPRIWRKDIEPVLTRRTGYQERNEQLVGYADLIFHTQTPIVTLIDDNDTIDIGWEHGPSLLLEVKSKMPTLGELMRQLQLYRTAFKGLLVVVSPDDRYASILGEQEVHFIKCPDV